MPIPTRSQSLPALSVIRPFIGPIVLQATEWLGWRPVVAFFVVIPGCKAELPPPPSPTQGLPTTVVAEQGLDAPTAVVHDSRADVYLVTNAPAARGRSGNQGFIARLAPSGRVVRQRWIEGGKGRVELRAPSAITIRGDTLFVADRSCIRLFHRESGEPLESICPEGADELVGLTVRNGDVYVTDRKAAPGNGFSVLTISSTGGVASVAGSEALSGISGITAGPWGLFVTQTGEDYVSQLTPTGPRAVLRGSAKRVGGIVAARAGSFAFSNSTDSTVLYVDVRFSKGRGALYTLARQIAEPGQLGYDARRDRILIPETGRNRITLVELMNSEGAWMPDYQIR